ncbi:MAG: RNA-binding transcriptional accessory protein [Planctomycetia bacterium]|nr:RNA-binding transcriptional accessory protein [Planctomycetia bacterium]
MSTTSIIDLRPLAAELHLDPEAVLAVVDLLDNGNTVPFITRYRKDQTGGLNEDVIRAVQARVEKLRLLAQRKQTILKSIESQQQLTPELAESIEKADSFRRLEDLYLPFKPKKQTLATIARERGLELLADEIQAAAASCANLDERAKDFANPDRQVPTAADALLGAGHIVAERFSERTDVRERLRAIIERTGRLVSAKVAPAEPAPAPATPVGENGQPAPAPAPTPEPPPKGRHRNKNKHRSPDAFRDFFNYSEAIGKVPPHRVLAINRAERARAVRVKIEADAAEMQKVVDELLIPPGHPHADFLRGCAQDALARLILPSLEREIRRELTDHAEAQAVTVFARNLRNLLLQPPVRERRVLAVDPGYKSGCKVVALDQIGNPLAHEVVHVVSRGDEKRAAAKARLVELVNQHNYSVVAIGNGSGCRDAEALVAEIIAENATAQPLAYVIVNEAGASVYSASPVGREEFPQFDATVRGAISIGRRLLDPLSELVKIEPANIGVGMYQHDVKAKHLQASLDAVVQSCVNYVGVDANTASVSLLRYVSGLNQLTARRLVEYRQQHGPFKTRSEFLSVPNLGDATYVQAAGFLRISGGENPFDGTWIHPESYEVAEKVLSRTGLSRQELVDKQHAERLAAAVGQIDAPALAAELGTGTHLLRDILAQFTRPGRDPREDLPPPLFKRGILKLEDLQPGMELTGSVLNVVDFGAFVDIGLKDSGLVHISHLSTKFVDDPHKVVAVGDIVRVWVLSVDKERRRVSLSMVAPGTPRDIERKGRPDYPRRQPPKRPLSADGQPTDGQPADGAGQEGGQRPPRRDRPRRRKPARAGTGGYAGQGAPQAQGAGATTGVAQPAAAQSRAAYANPPKRKSDLPPPKLTKAMKAGKEPLRTFGQLQQFFKLKTNDDEQEKTP